MKINLNQPNGFTSMFAPDSHKYIDTSNPIEHRKASRFNPYQLNYGTVVAVAGKDFVVVGGDTRLSEGYSIITRGQSKLVQLTNKTILATSGMYADFCELKKVLRAKLQIYEYKIDRAPSTLSIANLISKTLYGRRFFPYYTFNLVAGLDDQGRGVVYGYDAIGSYNDAPALAQGSGAHMILPFLDAECVGYNNPYHDQKPPMTEESAVELIEKAFRSAAERDIYTGDKLWSKNYMEAATQGLIDCAWDLYVRKYLKKQRSLGLKRVDQRNFAQFQQHTFFNNEKVYLSFQILSRSYKTDFISQQ